MGKRPREKEPKTLGKTVAQREKETPVLQLAQGEKGNQKTQPLGLQSDHQVIDFSGLHGVAASSTEGAGDKGPFSGGIRISASQPPSASSAVSGHGSKASFGQTLVRSGWPPVGTRFRMA